ncbi:MAG TPA: hypothetical protein VFP22_05670 [Candidatus Limnocylindrales bacterium]|nr:hypothetical protein [Candidatus Limnocylindrales bacterium]
MFLSGMLSAAIHAEREREIERRTRDARLLAGPWKTTEPDPLVEAVGRSGRAAGRGPRPAASSGSACEPA